MIENNNIRDCYNLYFNGNDVFNHHLCYRYFPNSTRAGWKANYTDFLFAAIQMNIYVLWHEICGCADQIDNNKFTTSLYRCETMNNKRRSI